jgi:RNA polymerase sigma factor (sigma-70 family)
LATEGASLRALEELYRGRYHRFLRVAEAVAGDVERGRDAVQEGFARAIRHRHDFRGDGSLESWVWMCVLNAARVSVGRRETPHESLDDWQQAPACAEATDISLLLADLPERQRLALFLRYYADLDYQAIAGALGVELGTVGATLNKAHAALRRQLEEVQL